MGKWADPIFRAEYQKKYFQAHKEAYRISRMKFARKNPEKWLSYQRKSKYGVDLIQWRKMAVHGCEICGGLATHVDHNHKTNKVRGALCNNCNTGLGMFKDNSLLLAKACYYIRTKEGLLS